MKKLINLTVLAVAGLTISTSLQASNLMDEKAMCDVKANGIEKVIATAKKYNEEAKAKKVEFRRQGVNNTDLIISVEEAIKTGAKEVNPVDYKGKKTDTVISTEFGAERACKFAISALNQAVEAKSTWKMFIPGDGYKY